MKDQGFNTADIGAELGTEGVGSVVSKVEAYCAHEEQRIALANEPHIIALKAEASWLLDEERDVLGRLQLVPLGGLRNRRRKAVYYAFVCGLLTLAAFVFSLYSFEPFRLGLKAYLYCLGIAVVTPFLVEQAIERWNAESIVKSLATVASVAALVSLIMLAVIRGDLTAESIKNQAPLITFDDGPQDSPTQENNFYNQTIPLLQIVTALLALAMELGAGLALREVWRLTSEVQEDWAALRRRLGEIRQRLAELAFQITTLQREPSVFVARFWRNFYRAMLTHTLRSAMTKLTITIVALILLIHGYSFGQSTFIVTGLDMSQSVAVKAPDGKSEFQKNVDAIAALLAKVPTDSRVTVIGITDHSFTQPMIILSARIPADPGYFGERLNVARRELTRAWAAKINTLTPRYKQTDVAGAFVLAGQLFDQASESTRKILILYSDMRNSTVEFNLESRQTIPTFSSLRGAFAERMARLDGVDVYALGVDGAGKSAEYWAGLREFWGNFIQTSGGQLCRYTVLRTADVKHKEKGNSQTDREVH